MANEEHLELFGQGVKEWNQWRDNNPKIKPDLSEADLVEASLTKLFDSEELLAILSKLDLGRVNELLPNLREGNLRESPELLAILNRFHSGGVNLSGINLSGTIVNGSNLCGAYLYDANLKGASLIGSNLSGSNLRRSNLDEANLSEANLSKANLRQCNLREVDLRRADLGCSELCTARLSLADLSGSNLSKADLSSVSMLAANLSGATLIEVNLSEANLGGSNLSKADFRRANLNGSNLIEVNLREANLSDAKLLCGVELHKADLSDSILYKADLYRANLSDANLSGANLSDTNLSGANLSGANLSGANLSDARLRRTQALRTNFDKAVFTGTCLEDWNTNSATSFEGAICEYVYLKAKKQERRPREGSFNSGEFAALCQQAIDTIDLIFKDGIDWPTFLQTFQDLRKQYPDQDLAIQAIEKKRDGAFIVRLEVSLPGGKTSIESCNTADKASIESSAKRAYETKLTLMEQRYREVLQAKEGEIVAYKEQSANLIEIVKLQASRPITVEATAVAENSASKYNLSNAQFAGGFAETVQGDQIGGTINNAAAETPSLAEAAAEIQDLLKQLEASNPTATEAEQTAYLSALIPPTKRERFVGALKAAGGVAIEEVPYGAVLKALVEGWQRLNG